MKTTKSTYFKTDNDEYCGLDPLEKLYWQRQDAKGAAFLLVIPGCAAIGSGIALLVSHWVPSSLIGFGVGLLLWGL